MTKSASRPVLRPATRDELEPNMLVWHNRFKRIGQVTCLGQGVLTHFGQRVRVTEKGESGDNTRLTSWGISQVMWIDLQRGERVRHRASKDMAVVGGTGNGPPRVSSQGRAIAVKVEGQATKHVVRVWQPDKIEHA